MTWIEQAPNPHFKFLNNKMASEIPPGPHILTHPIKSKLRYASTRMSKSKNTEIVSCELFLGNSVLQTNAQGISCTGIICKMLAQAEEFTGGN